MARKEKPRPKPRRGAHSVKIEGAIVFRGNITVFKSATHLDRFIIVADGKEAVEVEVRDDT